MPAARVVPVPEFGGHATERDYTEWRRARYDFIMKNARTITVRRAIAIALVFCAAAACIVAVAQEAFGPRDALWIVVHDDCVPDELHSHDPSPCARVDLDGGIEKGFVILKDIRGGEQFLLIPTARIPGIESPVILAPDAPNYFADAWDAQKYLEDAVGRTLPRDDISLAINSVAGRSQDQLHIHVDCVRQDVQAALREQASSIGQQWAPINFAFTEHHYWAMWVAGDQLGANNPFRLLADGLPGAAQNMGDRTLVVVGATRANGDAGFVILEDQVDRENYDNANGEELMDHACRIVTAPGAAAAPKN
jgi:CDP-diacylglycerol pyrophosphatase